MELINILAIAVALAMDAFAVSIAAGVALKCVSLRQTFRLAWHFGLFQAMMPVIGWSAGLTVRSRIEAYDHWVAFALLAFVAQGMLRSAFKGGSDEAACKDPTRGMTMVMLSVATSIDAFAVGVSLGLIGMSIWAPAAIIGFVTILLSYLATHLGRRVGPYLGQWAERIGGLILIGVGTHILTQQLMEIS